MASTGSPVSLPDKQILTDYGRDIMQVLWVLWLFGIIALLQRFTGAYGIFFTFAVYSILRRGPKSHGSIIMLCAVVYLYAASVVQWAVDLSTAFEAIHSVLMVPNIPIPNRAALASESTRKFDVPAEALFLINMLLADCVVIWRTWAIYQHRILAIFMPCMLLFISFVFSAIDLKCRTFDADGLARPHWARQICPQTELVAWACSVATNVTCTIFIGVKAWRHRNLMRELNFTASPHRISTEKILSILVESGFIYSLLWLSRILLFIDVAPSSPWYFVLAVLMPMHNQLSGMYPTLIIVIVNFRRTIWDHQSTSAMSNNIVFNTLQWSVKRPTNTSDTRTSRVDSHPESVIDVGLENSGFMGERHEEV
ncbi:hypothetical protein MSAN_02007100 [Mycena sanguinolenta]|uniref:Uncharacterized protein n=1 Tax=Mycena sanguinolenta TaxID=230812 RepID=A0A8H6XM12_9AGAR|nr:hypothetical protein MSAN_02007100 [Mycena sanguinolenta]